MINKEGNAKFDEELKLLYKKFFSDYFKKEHKNIYSKSSSSPTSKISSIKSFGKVVSSSTIYETMKSLSLPSSGNSKKSVKNPKLPTVPQSIINNICKTIHKNKLPKRGMLIWHSTGSGKTCTATSIMDGFWGTKQKIIYCSSRDALTSNPPINFYKCATDLFPRFAGKSLDEVDKEFRNVSFLSFAQLANRLKNKVFNLNDCILIIDEVHNLFRPLANQRGQHEYVEKLLVSGATKFPKMKVFILTATLGDNPDEIFKLLNIVRDNNTPEIVKNDLDNVDEFKTKIRGLVSYFDMSNDSSKFPIVKYEEPKVINMSKRQFEEYITKYKEIKDDAKNYDKLSKLNSLNKYWAAARRYSNMLYNFEKGLTLREFSAKLEELLNSVYSYPNQKQYIYSAFYENKGYGGHGILAIAKQLEAKGYSRLTPSEAIKIMENPNEDNKKPRYILAISTQLGTNKGADLDKMRALFNASYNKNGEYVQLFLASQTYNEGIDLKAVRHIHIFEPLITWASDRQTIGRAARLCSHSDLDKNDWDVTIHRYMSSFPSDKANPEIMNKKLELASVIESLEQEGIKLKLDYDNYSKEVKQLKKDITAAKKAKIAYDDINEKLEYANNNVIVLKTEIAKNKNEVKELQKQIKKYDDNDQEGKGAKKTKKKIDATGVENIDKFIYDNAISKMQNILTLYQAMKEAAIDCQVLQKFHSSGNLNISCQKY